MNAENETATIAGSEIIGHPTGDDGDHTVKTYDFKRPMKFSKDAIRTMAIMHEVFCRLTTTSLSASLQSSVQIKLSSVDQLTYEEFIRSVPNPCMLSIINMDPLKGSAVLEIDPAITSAMVDRLFGGNGEILVSKHELTEVEISVLEGLIIRILGNLREAWSLVTNLRPRLGQIETDPQYAQMLPPTEMVALVSLATQIGDAKGMMNLCIPYLTIERIIPKMSTRYIYSTQKRKSGSDDRPLDYIADIPVDASLCIDIERLSLNDVSALHQGTLIPLDSWDTGNAFIRCGGVQTECTRQDEKPNGVMTFTLPEPATVDLELNAPAGQAEPDRERQVGDEIGELIAEPITLAREELQLGFTRLTKQITELANRQDEMADQLMLTGAADRKEESEQEPVEQAMVKGSLGLLRPGDGESLRGFLRNEQPQTIAFVLSKVDPPLASHVLQHLEPELQTVVAERIYNIAHVSSGVCDAVGRVLEQQVKNQSAAETVVGVGHKRLAEILDIVSKSTEKHIVDSLEKRLPGVAQDISDQMTGG